MLDKTKIIERLMLVDKECELENVRLSIIIIGGAACILSYDVPRVTYDIDIVANIKSNLFRKYGIDVVSPGILNLSDDYKSRLIPVDNGFKALTVFTLHAIDIILTKIGRGSPKDIEDCRYLMKNSNIDKILLINIFDDWKIDYIGSQDRLEATFNYIVGD